MASANECLSCGKKCTQKEAAVKCSVCGLWCHKACSGLTNEFFNCLAEQFKATKRTYWACRVCSTYAEGMNHRLREVQDQAKEAIRIGTENSAEIAKLKEMVIAERERADRAVSKMEAELREEMTRREERRRNIVVHGLIENSDKEGRKRLEADRRQLDEIFIILDVNVSETNDVEFCRRVGEQSDRPRPLIVGFFTEWAKDIVLKNARKLMDSELSGVTLVPDLTDKQRKAEKELTEEAERRNREELEEDDVAKNLSWKVVGKKGQRRLLKTVDRQDSTRGQFRGARGGTSHQRGLRAAAPVFAPRAAVPATRAPAAVVRGSGPARGMLLPRTGRASWTVRHQGQRRVPEEAEAGTSQERSSSRKRKGSGEEQAQQRPKKKGTRGRPAKTRGVARDEQSRSEDDMEDDREEEEEEMSQETVQSQEAGEGDELVEVVSSQEEQQEEEGLRLGSSQQ
jgi:hypothetical protein